MSKTFRLQQSNRTIKFTVTELDAKSRARTSEREYYPNDHRVNALTEIAQKIIQKRGHDASFHLLRSDDGFGWEITVWAKRPCPECKKPIYEFEPQFRDGPRCLTCEIDRKLSKSALRDAVAAASFATNA